MSKKSRAKTRGDAPTTNKTVSWLCSPEAYDLLVCEGYTRLSDSPDVQMGVNYLADLISSMPIHLMKNTPKGDIRQKNELARKVDVNPYRWAGRKTWMFNIVRNMLIEGNQVVYPHTKKGLLDDLDPLEPDLVSFVPDGRGYRILYSGRYIDPGDVLHFLVNPDKNMPWLGNGYRVALKEVINNLRQAAKTKKGFMESKWKPSVIVKVDGINEQFANKTGRKKLLTEYIETSEAGEPWIIPAEQFDVQQVKPLSLNDLAINEAVTLDKRAVAGILGVTPYVLGAGTFDEDEHRNMIDSSVKPKAQIIEQELTRKLLLAPDLFWKMNGRALYGYNMKVLAEVGLDFYVRGLLTGNQVLNWVDMPPADGLDERVILENYIPAGMIGKQKKLNPDAGEK